MGDRVAVLRKGALQQCDAPQTPLRAARQPLRRELHRQPGDEPRPGADRAGRREARVRDRLAAAASCPARCVARLPALRAYRRAGRSRSASRPEHLQDAALAGHRGEGAGVLRGRVVTTELLGSEVLAHVEVEAAPVVTQEVLEVAGDTDRALAEDLRSEASERRTTFVCRFAIETAVRAGRRGARRASRPTSSSSSTSRPRPRSRAGR